MSEDEWKAINAMREDVAYIRGKVSLIQKVLIAIVAAIVAGYFN